MPRELTHKQKLQWDHRRLNAIVGSVLSMRSRFEGNELEQVINNVNAAMKRIETAQKTYKPPKVAKRWSDAK